MSHNFFDVIIIGAGPAGLMTTCKIKNKRVLLLEKNSNAGAKLLISGSGRCNFTHDGIIRDFITHYGAHGRFLKQALYKFDNTKTVAFFKDRGLDNYVDKNGKIFPISDNAQDVLSLLIDDCKKNNVEFFVHSSVLEIVKIENTFSVKIEDEIFKASIVVIATGGKSYPKTGSSGDGYRLAKSLNHNIIEPRPALTPLIFSNFAYAEISGVTLYNRIVYLFRNGKKINEYQGDIGFTHKGLSGPGILDFSRYFQLGDQLKINVCNLNSDLFREQFISDCITHGKQALKNYLKSFDISESLILMILQKINIDSSTTLATISKNQRILIVENFTALSFDIQGIGGFNQAMVTTGGIDLAEVNPKSMESKLVKNLFFAGEVLDIDGDTGGYNIQAAFSTGNLVAETINCRDETAK